MSLKAFFSKALYVSVVSGFMAELGFEIPPCVPM